MLSTQYLAQSKRVRDVMPRLNCMIEKVKENIIQLKYLNAKSLPADFGTKSHFPIDHRRKMDKVMENQNVAE